MKKKTAVLATSVATIAVCSSIIAGSTFALFTSESKTDIVVKSANVKMSATVENTECTHKVYDLTAGEYVTAEGLYGGTASFSSSTLTIVNFVPLDSVKFDLVITNESTVTVKYRTKILCTENPEFLSHLDVTVDGVEYDGSKVVTDWTVAEVGAEIAPVTVEIAFPDKEDNNDYKDQTCTISYYIEAVQGNAYIAPDPDEKLDLFEVKYDDDTCYIMGLKSGVTVNEITIPATSNGKPVSVLGGAFKDNDALEIVNVDAETIGDAAFAGCENLKEVYIGENVKHIENNAFYAHEEVIDARWDIVEMTSSLEKVVFSENSALESIGSYAFGYCDKLVSVVLPDSVTGVGSYVFYGCDNLTSVTMPKGLMPETPKAVMSKAEYLDKYVTNVDSIIADVNAFAATINLSDLEELTRETYGYVGWYELKQVFYAQYDSVQDMIDTLGAKQFAYAIGFFYYNDSTSSIAWDMPESYGISVEELQAIFDGIEGIDDYRYIGWLYYGNNGSTGEALENAIRDYLSEENLNSLYAKYLEAVDGMSDLNMKDMISGSAVETITFNGNVAEWDERVTADYIGIYPGTSVTVVCNDGTIEL